MGEIIKHAKLFEAGVYEDKGIEVTEADLDALVAETGEVPLTIGHLDPARENPLRLGVVGGLYRKGRELFGVVRFVPEAWALAVRSGARWLSVCLDRLRRRLVEVSLVVSPRVEDARVKMSAAGAAGTGSRELGIGGCDAGAGPDAPADNPHPSPLPLETGEGVDVLQQTLPFDTSLDERASAVRASVYSAMGPDVWVAEVFDDRAIVERGAALFEVDYSVGSDGTVTVGDARPVERRYVPLTEESTAEVDSGVGNELARNGAEEAVGSEGGTVVMVGERTARNPGAFGGRTARSARTDAAGPNSRLMEALAREREALRLLHEERMEGLLARWQREGQVSPVGEPAARALLMRGPEVADEFVRFVEAQAPGLLMAEVVPAAPQAEELPELDEGEVAFCQRSGIEPEDYRRMKVRPGWRARE